MRSENIKILSIITIMILIIISGIVLSEQALALDFSIKNTAPCLKYIFGTDTYGRDIFARTLSGLSKSLILGILASCLSGILALIIGIIAGTAPKFIDEMINFVIDAIMSIPHLILLILISFCLGKGLFGVVTGTILTHWTSLA
ncbi:MAG: ABC transporter permease, partial [Clostridia bacterium]